MIDRELRAALGRRTILVTGGAGFIGLAVCRLLRDTTEWWDDIFRSGRYGGERLGLDQRQVAGA